MIAFLVVNGFSLFDVRKLYIDEMFEFYDETIYTLQITGKVKAGTYDKIKALKEDSAQGSDAAQFRSQLFRAIRKKP